MRSRRALLTAFIAMLLFPAVALSEAVTPPPRFTLQVAAFPDSAAADRFIATLTRAGERPIWGTIDLPGRGRWIRVFIGSFKTQSDARRYGTDLIDKGLIKEFMVKPAREIRLLSRPRSFSGEDELTTDSGSRPAAVAPTMTGKHLEQAAVLSTSRGSSLETRTETDGLKGTSAEAGAVLISRTLHTGSSPSAAVSYPSRANASRSVAEPASYAKDKEQPETAGLLPPANGVGVSLIPSVNTDALPRPDPVVLAFELIMGEELTPSQSATGAGGLWVSGDVEEALARLRWIAGAEDADLLRVDGEGRVVICAGELAKAAGAAGRLPAVRPLIVSGYISANEGLLLLVQVTQGRFAYRLHIGNRAPTRGVEVPVSGSINLDNNFDPRINPYRKRGEKMSQERPPAKFDSLVAINPVARWFNLPANSLVPVGHITFHELAEAYAKLGLGLDYLGDQSRPGAHWVALEREARLKAQRPSECVVLTNGSNRVLRTEAEARHFFAEGSNPR